MLRGIAARQHGVVNREQLRLAGISPRMVVSRIANGRLVRVHRGVFAVGHDRLRDEGRWLAAVLACGRGAVLSHRSAAGLHGLRIDGRAAVDVSTHRHQRSDGPLRVHGRRTISHADATTVDGIPVTSVARTIVDLADVLRADDLAGTLRRADRAQLLDATAIEAALRRTVGRPGDGHRRLREALDRHALLGGQLTRSALEDRFLALVERAGLPRPSVNAWLPGIAGVGVEVDALWRAERVAVELDGWEHHRTRDAFQRDRAKGNALAFDGWTVLRFTHRDVAAEPELVAAQLRRALGRAVSSDVR